MKIAGVIFEDTYKRSDSFNFSSINQYFIYKQLFSRPYFTAFSEIQSDFIYKKRPICHIILFLNKKNSPSTCA